MSFLHNKSEGEIVKLIYVWKKWSYTNTWIKYNWHIKAVWVEDRTFNITDTSESTYKWTIKRLLTENDVDIQNSDKVLIGWTKYIVKAVKHFTWLSFKTAKVLLTK